MMKTYRRDIDALRAISVIFVIFFHVKLPFFESGFLGVDIFFVISGFLITKIIIEDIKLKKFSISHFYLRRVRRIIPLVLTVSISSYFIAYFILFPDELSQFKTNLFYVNTFVSNFWYYFKGSYFSPITDSDPLIHFWSLSVEEQYYLFYPLLFIFFFKKKNNKTVVSIILFLTLLSLILSQFGGNLKYKYPFIEEDFKFFSIPEFAFYSTFTRAWEILLGCMSAIYASNNPRIKNQKLLVNISFYLLIIFFFIVKKGFPHPSILTLIPILFTSIILIYNNNNISNNFFLNSKLLSSIGLISFSLYLWHQPIFVFFNKYNILETGYFLKFTILFFIFLISYISWKFIEKPFRNKNIVNNKNLFSFIFITILIFPSLIFISGDNKSVFKNNELSILDFKNNYEKKYFDDCTVMPKNYIKPENACIIGDKSQKKVEYAIIGDSHAATLAAAFDKEFKKINKSSYLFTINGCPITPELYNHKDNRFKCKKYYEDLRKFLMKNKSIKNLILHTRWSFYVSGKRFNNREGGKEEGKDTVFINNEKDLLISEKLRQKLVVDKTLKFINELSNNKNILILTSVPEVGFDVPSTIARGIKFKKVKELNDFTTSFEVYKFRQNLIETGFNELKFNKKFYIFDTSSVFCQNNNRCIYSIDNVPLYFDDDHLNIKGANLMVEKLFIEIF